MKELFVEMLRGNTNSLGRTEEVVAVILKNPQRVNELFDGFYQDDEWVRLRVNSALKRLWRHDKTLVQPFVTRWTKEVAHIEQPSINWTFAQLVEECPELFTDKEIDSALSTIKQYLTHSSDWIVLNSSIQTLSKRAKDDTALRTWLMPQLKKLTTHDKKSVAGRARKWLTQLQEG